MHRERKISTEKGRSTQKRVIRLEARGAKDSPQLQKLREKHRQDSSPTLRRTSSVILMLLASDLCLLLSSRSCPILCDPMECKLPGFPVLHYLLEFTQTRWICV